jgi:hypothetical protein
MAKPRRTRLGPDGRYPYGGPLKAGDRGAVTAALTLVPGQRHVQLELGTVLSWVAAPPAGARSQAAAMRALVQRHWGTLPYAVAELPIRVVANRETGQIESHFPQSLSVLRGNPEVFLAWAQRLEEAVAQLAAEASDA